jgi:hypothetical protein
VKGIDVATASIEVRGPGAERLAGELQGALVTGDLSGVDREQLEIDGKKQVTR